MLSIMIALVKLVAWNKDLGGYVTYVFECLEEYMIKETKYIMCTKFPNWEHKTLKLEDIGYLHFEERRAGIDKWFDGVNMVPYRYNTVQFMKFVNKPEKEDHKYIM